MSRPLLATSLLALALAACQGQAPSAPAAVDATATQAANSVQDTAFAALSARFLDEGMALSPISATQVGDHRFDTEVDDLSATGRQKSIDWARALHELGWG